MWMVDVQVRLNFIRCQSLILQILIGSQVFVELLNADEYSSLSVTSSEYLVIVIISQRLNDLQCLILLIEIDFDIPDFSCISHVVDLFVLFSTLLS